MFGVAAIIRSGGTESGTITQELIIHTTSVSTLWAATLTNNGGPLSWSVSGGVTIAEQEYTGNDVPTLNLESNTGTAIISIKSQSSFVGLIEFQANGISGNADNVIFVDVLKAVELVTLSVKEQANLTSIDISTLIDVQNITIRSNALTALDVSNNSDIIEAYVYSNQLTDFNVLHTPIINTLNITYNLIDSTELDLIVNRLDTLGQINGFLYIDNNAGTLTSDAYLGWQNLFDKGWNIDVAQPTEPGKIPDPKPGEALVLSHFHVKNLFPSRLYFDSSIVFTMTTVDGFVVSGKSFLNNTAITINTGELTDHYFTMASEFTFWDNNTIRLGEVTDTVNIQSTLHNFTLTYIENNIVEPSTSNNKYVAPLASGGGLSVDDPMDITAAWTEQLEDTTYWCAPGDYGNVNLVAGGTNTTGVTKFIGYKTNPVEDDISSIYYNHGDGVLVANEMPLLTGTTPGTNAVGMNTLYGKQNYIVKNFQITGYGDATKLRANNAHYENIITKDMGEDLPEGDDPYGGRGIFITHGSNIRALNCYAEDCSLANFSMMGIGNMTRGCESHGNGGVNHKYDVDYFYQIDARDGYTLGHNILLDSYAKRHFAIQHEGHGVSIQTPNATQINEHNLVDNCIFVSIYQAIEFRHEDTRFNVAKNIYCYAEGTVADGTGGVVFREATHDNVFENSRVIGTTDLTPIKFYNDFERGSGMSSDNLIRNNIFQGTGWAIHMREWTQENSNGDSNKIYNNTFDGFSDLFTSIYSTGVFTMTNNEFKNNIVYNVTNFENAAGDADGWTLDYNNFYADLPTVSMSPEGTNATTEDPDFVDTTDYVPQGALILAPKLFEVPYDYNNSERADTTTIGGVKNVAEIVIPITPIEGETPILSEFRVEELTPTLIHFESTTDVTGLTVTGFVVSGKGIPSAVHVDAGGLTGYFTVSSEFSFWDNNTIRLGENDGLTDANTKLHNFTLSYIKNNILEPTALTNRFVAVTPLGLEDGSSEANAASLSYMATNASLGQTWWIKAGNYGNTTISLLNSGTIDNPIKYIGYKTSWINGGDITTNYLQTYNDIVNNWDDTAMPTLVGVNSGNSISIGGDYTIIRNIQSRNHQKSIVSASSVSNVLIERFNQKENNVNLSYTGISLESSGIQRIRIKDVMSLNVVASGISIQSTASGFHLFENCRVYSGAGFSQEYFIGLNGSNSIIRECDIYMPSELSSKHGIGIKAVDPLEDNNYNLIERNTAKGIAESYYIRNNRSYHNVVKDNYGEGITGGTRSGGIYLWGGVRYNVVERNKFIDLKDNFIRISDNSEPSADEVGAYNILRNNIFDGAAKRVMAGASDAVESLFNDNYFYNNTFKDSILFYYNSAAPWDGVVIQNLNWNNNLFINITPDGFSQSTDAGMFFNNNVFWGCGTWADTYINSNGNTNENPGLDVNYIPSNEVIVATKFSNVTEDYNRKERADITTVGAVTLDSETVNPIIYYVSSSYINADDSNPGTEALPWKTLAKVEATITSADAGKTIAFKKGDTWNEKLQFTGLNGTVGSEITFTSYGNGDKPIFTTVIESALTWTDQGSNVWTAPMTSNIRRLKFDGVEVLGSWVASQLNQDIPDNVKWALENDILSIYSTDTPSNHTVEISEESTTFYLISSSNIIITDIEFQGGESNSATVKGCSNITFDNVRAGIMSTVGIMAFQDGTQNTNINIINSLFDTEFTLDYSGDIDDAFSSEQHGGSDGITLRSCDGGEIYGNTFKNWGHAGVGMNNAAGSDEVQNIKMYDNVMSSPDIAYGGRLTMGGNVHDIEIYNNIFEDLKNHNILNSQNTHFHHNIVRNITKSPIYPTDRQYGVSFSTSGGTMNVTGCVVENNNFINIDSGAIKMTAVTGFLLTNNIIRNNILYDCGINLANRGILMYEPTEVYDNTYENNLFYNTTGSAVVYYYGADIDVTAFNAKADYGNIIALNIEGNPLFTNVLSDWHLESGSPAINTGIGPALSTIDYYGETMDLTTPDIGISDNN